MYKAEVNPNSFWYANRDKRPQRLVFHDNSIF